MCSDDCVIYLLIICEYLEEPVHISTSVFKMLWAYWSGLFFQDKSVLNPGIDPNYRTSALKRFIILPFPWDRWIDTYR